jgi:hypothetical protein
VIILKKLFVICDDGSKTIYTIKDSVDHMKYVNRHINYNYVKDIILQQYPKKDNKEIRYK